MTNNFQPFGSHELDAAIDYPVFHDLERKRRIRSLPVRVLLRIVGSISLAIGVLGSVSAPFYRSQATIQQFDFPGVEGQTEAEFWIDLLSRIALYLVAGIALLVIARQAKKKDLALAQQITSQTSAAISSERDRLQKIKDNMSIAEWESYKLQIENQRILKQIKNRPTTAKTQTTTTFGYTEE